MSGAKQWASESWHVSTMKAPILDSAELDKLEKDVGIPMPEMVFGNNFLEITHKPSGFSIKFDTASALDAVDKVLGQKTPVLQVAHSKEWKASKVKHKAEVPPAPGQIDYDVNRVHKPFDWTYTTSYAGTITGANGPVPSEEGIPYEELKKPDPILFFDEVQLYEDELGDFGLATYSVKIRVMPTSLFILARLYVRVDNVAFRIRDTRIYVHLDSATAIREYSEKEASYEAVKQKVPIWAEDFTQMLRDPNWVDSAMPVQKKEMCRLN